MTTDSVVIFLIMWGIPAFMVIRTYRKMGADEQNDAKRDLKSAKFIFTIGFLLVGGFLVSLGNALAIGSMEVTGISIMAIGGLIAVAREWRRDKKRSLVLLLLISVAAFFLAD